MIKKLLLSSLVVVVRGVSIAVAQEPSGTAAAIPKTWDDAAMATLEVPLANPVGPPHPRGLCSDRLQALRREDTPRERSSLRFGSFGGRSHSVDCVS